MGLLKSAISSVGNSVVRLSSGASWGWLKIRNAWLKRRHSDIRAIMHQPSILRRDKLMDYDPSQHHYEWVLIAKPSKRSFWFR